MRFDQTGASGDVDIIRLSKSWRSRVMDNYFKGASTTHRRGLQMAAHSERSWIMHNVFEGCGVYLNEVNAQWVVDNEIGAGRYGIEYLGSTVSQTGYGSHIHANHIYNSSENQIHLDKVNGATITENHLEDGDKHGIALRTGCKNCRITHNVVKKNSKSAAGIYSGIDLNSEDASSPTEYNDISDNAVYDDFGVPTQGYGVRLRSLTGSQTNNNTITNNTLYGNTVAQLEEAAGLTNFIDTQVGWGSGSATWNPASVANGAQATTTVTVTGAKLGDLVDVSFSLDLQAMQLTGHVSAANTVTVVLRNGTGGAIDLGSGTLKAQIRRG